MYLFLLFSTFQLHSLNSRKSLSILLSGLVFCEGSHIVNCKEAHQNLQFLFLFFLPSVLILPGFGAESVECCTGWDGEGKQGQRKIQCLI